MELVLEITSSEQFLLGENATKTFFPVGGVIGRSPDCDWVIPDQSRHMSGRHAVISAEGESFYITDVSTNGIFLNGSKTPIEKNKPHKLSSDDQVTMGDMQFRAVIHLDATRNGFTPSHFGAVKVGESAPPEPVLDPLALLRQKMPNIAANAEDPVSAASQLDQWHNTSNSMPDGLPAIQETFSAPSMSAEKLPENWNMTNSEPFTAAEHLVSPMSSQPVAETAPQAFPPQAHLNLLSSDPFGSPVVVSPASHNPVSMDAHLRAFCRGIGVSPDDLGETDTEALMEQAGQALKETFTGVVNVMKGRASLKNEFRMDMTLVQLDKNNPLKFAVDDKQVLKHFLGKSNDSFLSIPNALQESFQDIQEHQIGVMAAVQASLTQLLDKVDPEYLEEKFDRRHSKSFSITGKRARYWESYRDYHSEIQQEEATFSSVFGDTFSKTYNDQVGRLKAVKGQK